MRKNRAKTYRGTFAPDVNAHNSAAYAHILAEVRHLNILAENAGYPVKYVARKRYRGPRIGKKYNRQSMCLRKDAVRCDVYVYGERIWGTENVIISNAFRA